MKLKLVLAIAVCLFAFACNKNAQQAKQEPPKKIVLEVGSAKLSDEDVNLMFSQLPLEQKNRYLEKKETGKQQFVNDLADKQLFVQAAKDQKLTDKPPVHAMLEMAENSVLYSAYYRAEILDKIVPEQQVRAFYDSNKERFFHPEQVKIRHILVTPRAEGQQLANSTGDDAKSPADAKAKIEKLIATLKSGAKFDEVARQYSEDPSAQNGGEMDWITRSGRLPEAFENAAFSIQKPGQVVGPVTTQYGIHLIQLLERHERTYFDYEDVRNEIQNQLAGQRGEAVQQAYEKLVKELQAKYPKKITMGNLK